MTMIQLQGLGLAFPHKTCFSEFNGAIEWGQRIAIVGDNGSGKSSLLHMLNGELEPSEGSVCASSELSIGYLKQVQDDEPLSGGERVNQALSLALARVPDLLLLDEPTNHLDTNNRRSLSRMLQNYTGSIVLVTHDEALMNQVCDTIWHIAQNKITIFHSRYADYLAEQQLQREILEKKLASIKRAQQDTHDALMKEQERASHAKKRGEISIKNRKWATIKSPTKLGRGNTTSGRKQSEISAQRRELVEQLDQLPSMEIIVPRFHLEAQNTKQTIVQIRNGEVGYETPLINNINLSLSQGERVALVGKNGSGKSTLARAIAQHPEIIQSGDWLLPAPEHIGYLDQHYDCLKPQHTVLETLINVVPHWTQLELRRHLSDFLFRQNELVQNQVSTLSGGEKARLSLACIAACPPQLLILDELTNNLDMRMRRHMVEILRNYPGALLLISHDEDFLEQVGQVQRLFINYSVKDITKLLNYK
jgi:ATPase subunit of ABC transporter with duplicated ATPase domains